MRPSIRQAGILVACLSAGIAFAAAAAGPSESPEAAKKTKKVGKASPIQKEADAFLSTVSGVVLPVSTSASLADWAAATDVTPEHVAQRTGADKALAAA